MRPGHTRTDRRNFVCAAGTTNRSAKHERSDGLKRFPGAADSDFLSIRIGESLSARPVSATYQFGAVAVDVSLNLNSRFDQSRPKLSSCSISESAAFSNPDKTSMNRKTCVNALRGTLMFLLLAFLALCSLPANAAPPPSGVA